MSGGARIVKERYIDEDYIVDEFGIENDDELNIDLEINSRYVIGEFDSIKSHLEYERDYDILTPDELIDLIYLAKENNWKALDLTDCGIKELPPEIGILEGLEYLDLSSQINNSEIDEIQRNSLEFLPKEIGNLKKLKELSLYGLGLKKLPCEIKKLTNMEFINANYNNFEVFPEELTFLENLEFLALDRVNYEIPNSIVRLQNLTYLYLPDMMLKTLPEYIGTFHNLRELYLGRGKLEKIPESFANLNNLVEFRIEENPVILNIPPEIFNQSPQQIIDYILKYQRNGNKTVLNESKMIIVGQGGVGKTTLLNRIVNNIYKESPSTEGIDIKNWAFESNEKSYTLNIWDFGGQEIYHSTHQFFLTKRSLYIFVWDARQEDEYGRIDYWLNTIQSFSDNSPIIVVINKCDNSRKNIRLPDYADLKKRFPQIVDFFNVSCLDNINISPLRNEIINQAKKLPLMETDWFTSWANIREKLEQMSKEKNMIRYEEYLAICLEEEIEEKEARSLIKYLHDLGVLLHFHNDVLLKNIVILSPEWGTDAVYKILDAQANILKDRNGLLYYSDLNKIWDDKTKYPESIYPYILKLMENFQLSFTVEQHNTFLIPELLGNSAIYDDIDFNNKSLNFRYKYNFLPAGIMTRFIVKAHKFLVDKNGTKVCWRKGALLKSKDTLCLVSLEDGILEKYIDIKVIGENRRYKSEFLTIIRRLFEEIHNSITKISLVELVQCNCSDDCDYLHEYKYLLRLEEIGESKERCKKTLKEVNVLSLLDGIELKAERGRKLVEINFSPTINNNNNNNISVSNDNNLSNETSISIEVKNTLQELQGNTNELLEEVPDEAKEDVERINKALKAIENIETKEELKKSGALSKIKRVLEELSDPDSSTGKLINGTKYGFSILQDIAEKYNSIAEWCALPVIPKFFVKK